MYASLELGQPERPPCPDEYNQDSTLLCPGAKRLFLQISNQAIYIELGVMDQGVGIGAGSVRWQSPEPYLPLITSLRRTFDAVRVKNYKPGAAAQVFVTVS